MPLNSFSFLLFFTAFFALYWLLKRHLRWQNTLLLAGSYLFYAMADWRMCMLLLAATCVFYGLGLLVQKHAGSEGYKDRLWTTLGVVLGVGMLLYFKYLNFFIDSIATLLRMAGLQSHPSTLRVIMPVGVSFFTFKLISYVLEIHRQRMDACRDVAAFASYVAFFPTIMSGPIDRPNKLLPQLLSPRKFQYGQASEGCRQILWGLVKKMLVADNLAPVVASVWQSAAAGTATSPGASACWVALLLYPVQMYMDFSGYSDMAIGVSKLLGFRITANFRYPFQALNVAEYWRRWHISLTGWLTDYVFTPLSLALRDWGKWGICLAIVINMVLVGLWHGANWTFALFGLYHGLLFVPLIFSGAFSRHAKPAVGHLGLPAFHDLLRMCGTYLLVAVGLVIFRADSVPQAVHFMVHALGISSPLGAAPLLADLNLSERHLFRLIIAILLSLLIFALEWRSRTQEFPQPLYSLYRRFAALPQNANPLPKYCFRFSLLLSYALVIIFLLLFCGTAARFIYFAF